MEVLLSHSTALLNENVQSTVGNYAVSKETHSKSKSIIFEAIKLQIRFNTDFYVHNTLVYVFMFLFNSINVFSYSS